MVGIDTNILLYAYDRASPLFEPAKQFIASACEEGIIGLADLSLLEFYSVITNGRKIPKPLSPSEAAEIVDDILSADEFQVFCFNHLILNKTLSYARKHNIVRYGINDVYIAQTLAHYGIDSIFTANVKDFGRFDFIETIDPFPPSAMPSAPCASRSIPYARQSIDEHDVAAVCSVLRSDWLTTGPKVAEFEQAVADYVGAKHAGAVSSGTAALHAAMFALGIEPGDEVIVPAMTFAATVNCVLYQGGTPVFADVDPNTLLLDHGQVETKITPNTVAIIGVDYAGQPCEWDALREIADRHNLHLVDDGCHALGAEYKGKKVGTLADLTVFSFHPVKHIATGEGGMIVTDNPDLAERMRVFRNHGITNDHRQREAKGSWFYAMEFLGYNYRITDFQCALGLSQLQKLPEFLRRRREIAARYDEALGDILGIEPIGLRGDVQTASQGANREARRAGGLTPNSCDQRYAPCSMPHALCPILSSHAYHLYVVRVDSDVVGTNRAALFTNLREKGIAVNVHYIPVHLHPFYKEKFNTRPGLCPNAEAVYEQIISLPMFPDMTDNDVGKVIKAVKKVMP